MRTYDVEVKMLIKIEADNPGAAATVVSNSIVVALHKAKMPQLKRREIEILATEEPR